MTRDEIVANLSAFFEAEILEGADVGLDASTPLLELGLLNSMSVLLLLDHVEKAFGVLIAREDLKPENLKDLTTIASLIERGRAQAGSGA